ncbi:MAG: hypothetical protein ACOYN5_03730, partial [Bacteroidales bacterium]
YCTLIDNKRSHYDFTQTNREPKGSLFVFRLIRASRVNSLPLPIIKLFYGFSSKCYDAFYR